MFVLWGLATHLAAQPFQESEVNYVSFENKPSYSLSGKNLHSLAADTLDFSDYGGKVGFGISIFSGTGLPLRYYFNPKNVVEGGVYVGGVAIRREDINGNFESLDYIGNFMLGVGYTYFGSRFLKEKKNKNKVRAHGIAVRGNYLLGNFKTTFASLGWAMETFRQERKNKSFIFELGLQAAFPDFVYRDLKYSGVWPGLYLRCHWNFFLN
ncbi:MAG: hypothetical protein KIS77_16495 [Saprospiraceae bacterium]|nr:hypothetical protein [Saprospiraceae bacterium]